MTVIFSEQDLETWNHCDKLRVHNKHLMYIYRWTVIVLQLCSHSVFSEQTKDYRMGIRKDNWFSAVVWKPVSEFFLFFL